MLVTAVVQTNGWDTSDTITIIGWGITAVLASVGTLLVARLQAKRRRMTWTVSEEVQIAGSNSLGSAVSGFSVPIEIRVGRKVPETLHLVVFRIGNTGNQEIVDASIPLIVPEAEILDLVIETESSEYTKTIESKHSDGRAELSVSFINPGQEIEVRLLVSGYKTQTATADPVLSGVSVRRAKGLDFSSELKRRRLAWSLDLPFARLRSDPTALETARIADMLDKSTYSLQTSLQSLAWSMQRIESEIRRIGMQRRFSIQPSARERPSSASTTRGQDSLDSPSESESSPNDDV